MIIDTHTHLNDPAFASDLEAVLARAAAAGVTAMIVAGYDLPSSQQAVALAERYPALWAAVGVHPHDARDFTPAMREELRRLATHPRVVAIGETGLDFYYNHSPRQAQIAAFQAHLDLAAETGLPVIVHDRDAHTETMTLLQHWIEPTPARASGEPPDPSAQPGRTGVLHNFSGDLDMAHTAITLGFWIGIGGPVTYQKANRLREIVHRLPATRLLVETDSPYLAPHPQRGQRNEPAYIRNIVNAIANVRQVSAEEVASLTRRNTQQLFVRLEACLQKSLAT